MDEAGTIVASYRPDQFESYTYTHRNSYALSVGLSQVLHPKLQGAVFAIWCVKRDCCPTRFSVFIFKIDRTTILGIIKHWGVIKILPKPIYFMADDVERLPHHRLKIPLGARLNYYINENMVLRTYARYYQDDWGIRSETLQVELPVRLNLSWRVVPIYRYYAQTAADYFPAIQSTPIHGSILYFRL